MNIKLNRAKHLFSLDSFEMMAMMIRTDSNTMNKYEWSYYLIFVGETYEIYLFE